MKTPVSNYWRVFIWRFIALVSLLEGVRDTVTGKSNWHLIADAIVIAVFWTMADKEAAVAVLQGKLQDGSNEHRTH